MYNIYFYLFHYNRGKYKIREDGIFYLYGRKNPELWRIFAIIVLNDGWISL